MFRFASSLVAVVLLAIAGVGCQSEPVPEAAQPAPNPAGTEAKVLQLLAVNADGTVKVTDDTKAAQLIGSAWPAAQAELTALNRRIRSGETQGFRSTADLARYTHREPSYQLTLDENGTANLTIASSDANDSQCISKCDEGLCCCSGWWILCWRYCGCKP